MNELSLHILDICQNSTKANASLISIIIEESTKENTFTIDIIDNGDGMDKETLERVTDPFFTTRTTRKVGLGISLFKMAAEQSNGFLTILSEKTKGTSLKCMFELNNIDRAPLGKIEETIAILLLNAEGADIVYKHVVNDLIYIFDSREVKEVLEDVPLTDLNVIVWIKDNIKEGILNIHKEETLWNL